MTAPEDRVVELFSAAVDLPPAQRGAFLDNACGGDSRVRREVEELLRADERPGDVFDEEQLVGILPDIERLYETGREGVPALIPKDLKSIGPFKVTRLLGQGGMGLVYEALQEQPERRIAIKVVRPESLTEEVLVRFRNEAEFLSRLRHPGIPQIYESGVFEVGDQVVPYLAMELVEGTELLEWIEKSKPPVATRLDLIIQIADAVREAHEHGIIHRDLKPTNILVDPDGRARVLDFGIARAIDPDASVHGPTSAHQVLGTLAYMSPEQLDGDVHRLSFGTDVYALGVIAFETLTGELPHDVRGKRYTEVVRIINTQNPRSLARHDPSLKGELDLIVAKALAQDVEHRYPSARYLADDLGRFLRHEPVNARRPSSLYHLRKFARRRPLLVGLSVVLVLLLVASSLLLSLALNAAQDAATSAQLRERQARWQIYRSEVQQAGRRIMEDPIAAARHLDIARKQGTALGWEWHYLQTRLGSHHLEVELGEETRGSMGFDPAGRRLVAALADGTLAFIDTETTSVTKLAIPDGQATTARFSESGDQVIAGTSEGEILFVPIGGEDGTIRRRPALPGQSIQGLVWHGPSETLFTWTHGASYLERRKHAVANPPEGIGYVLDAAIDAAGVRLAVAGTEGWKLLELPGLRVIAQSTRSAWTVAFAAVSNELLVGTEFDGIIAVADERAPRSVSKGATTVSHVWPVGDGTLLVIENHRVFQLLDTTTGRVRASWPVGGTRARALAGSPKGRQFAVAPARSTTIQLRRLPSLDRRVLARHSTFVYDVAVDPTGRVVGSIDFDGEVRLTDVLTGRELCRWNSPDKRFLKFGPDSRTLYLFSHRTFADVLEVEIVDLLTRRRTLYGHREDGFAPLLRALEDRSGRFVLPPGIGVHPRGHLFVGPYEEEAFVVDRVEDLDPQTIAVRGRRLSRASALVERIRFNRTGSLFATASWDGTVGIWNTQSLDRVGVINVEGGRIGVADPAHRVYDVLFTPDGRRVLTGSRDGALRGWRLASRELVVVLEEHASYIHALVASPRGGLVVSASGDGTVRAWPSEPWPRVEAVRRRVDAVLSADELRSMNYDEVLRAIDLRLADREPERLDVRGQLLVRALSASTSIRLAPRVLDFGTLAPNETRSQPVTVHNDAPFPVTLTDLVVESSPVGIQAVTELAGPSLPSVLAPGEQVTARVQIRAAGPGSWVGRLRCHHNLGERVFAARARVIESGPPKTTEGALAFDGDTTGVRLPVMAVPEEFTWEFWLRDRDGGIEETVLSSTQLLLEGIRSDFSITSSTPYARITVCSGPTKRSFPFEPSWTWTHLAVVHERIETGPGVRISVYRNARLVGSFLLPAPLKPSRSRGWLLGHGRDQGRPSKHFRGDLSRVRLWGKALRHDEVRRCMTATSESLKGQPIVGIWNFRGDGNLVRDVSGHGNDASLSNPGPDRGRRFETPAPGRVLVMDPTRDRVQSSPLTCGPPLTCDPWVRVEQATGAVPLLAAKTPAGMLLELVLREGVLRMVTPNSDVVLGPLDAGQRTQGLPEPDGWHHLTLTLRRLDPRTSKLEVSVNGRKLGANPRLNITSDSAVQWILGSVSDATNNSDRPVRLLVDDFRIWSGVRSDAEPSRPPSVPGARVETQELLLWWDFEGNGDGVRDASRKGRHGHFTGSTTRPVRVLVH